MGQISSGHHLREALCLQVTGERRALLGLRSRVFSGHWGFPGYFGGAVSPPVIEVSSGLWREGKISRVIEGSLQDIGVHDLLGH